MINVKYITGANNYVVNFAIIGDLPNSKTVTVEDFDTLNYDCYKAVNGELVWDERKYREKINPTQNPATVTLEDYVLELEFRLSIIELGL